ncbi:alcohol dehydrogenase 1 [Aspergillus spectabilis]
MSIPELQWAQVAEKIGGPLVLKQIPVPRPGPDQILVKIKYSGGAGIVVAKGSLVSEFEIGDRAGLKWLNGSCGECEFCRQSDDPLCANAALSGYTVDGTFQQYALGKATHASKIPDGVPLDAAAPVLCAGITVYKGLKENGVRPGQTVAIVGAGGGLGSLAQQYAKAMGIRVVAVDGGMRTGLFDFTKSKDLIADVKAATPDGLGAHAVILLAVSEKPFQQATEYVRSRGTIIAIGLPPDAYLRAPVLNTVVRMISIKGSYVGNRQDGVEALDFFARGLIKAPFKLAPLQDLPQIFELMEQGKIAGRYVLELPE